MRSVATLYHLAEEANIGSILEHGLLSTDALLTLSGMPDAQRHDALRQHRPACVTLANGVLIRDQKPMPPKALAPTLGDGLVPADWYALLNGFVFFWPDRDRLERQRGACRPRPQRVMVFDGAALLRDFGPFARVSPINSGNARRRPAPRSLATVPSYAVWLAQGWPAADGKRGTKTRPVAEVLFACGIPARPPYLIAVEGDAAPGG